MKRKRILIAIVSLALLSTLLTSASVSVTAADNLAVNGDLELGSTNGWTVNSGAIETATVHGGSYALKLTATNAYAEAAMKTVPVRKNATITVSFYYRYASNPGNKLYHTFTYKGPNTYAGAYSSADVSWKTASGSNGWSKWQKASYTFNSGDYDAITLKFSPGGSGGTACYVDDLVVTSVGGDETEMDPYLTSFGTKMNRPVTASANVIKNGGFESTDGAQWNTASFFTGGDLRVVADPTAPEGEKSLYLDSGSTTAKKWYTFPVAVEKYTQYTFSAWVKAPWLSDHNDATATFGVVNAKTNQFLVYEPYNGNGLGTASLSTPTMQMMATAPDDAWHLRAVTFYSGSHTTVEIAVYGAESQLYLDDIALYKSANGMEYISSLRSDAIADAATVDNKYCADEDSLIKGIYMTTNDAQLSWSDNPAWRNGFLSFEETGDSHGTALKYTASANTAWQLHYIDWIDVQPNTSYTLTLDVKCLSRGNGRIALLDDDHDSPKEFYTIAFSATDSDWVTYSITFETASYFRIGFAIVDGGGSALIDEVRLFETADGIAEKPTEPLEPTLQPQCDSTATMEMDGDNLGVAFRMQLEGYRIYKDERNVANLSSAVVIPYGDGETYRLVRMGAVITNDPAVTASLTLDAVNGATVQDVPAVYLLDVTDTGCRFAVRITNVPLRHADTPIYACAYYVFEKDGEEVVVYGDIVSRSYNG